MNEAQEMELCFDRLWPLPRSITGEGVRRTHDILSEIIPLTRHEYPTGKKVLDWEIPKEWVVSDAYVVGPGGQRMLDVHDNNLHLVGYSIPFRGGVSLKQLEEHLYSMPERPGAIPYVTSYYKPAWGFCLSHDQRKSLPDGDYEVVVDTKLIDGSLTLSDLVIRGETDEEVLFHTYTCHPSLANNELSGPIVTAFLARRLMALPQRRLTYRFVFVPETIGAVAYLDTHGGHFRKHLLAGYICSCVGDGGVCHYKASRRGNTPADRVAEYVLDRRFGRNYRRRDFSPLGSDERQYCSIGFDLPVGVITRTMFGEYPEYHTSDDNKSLMDFEAMSEMVDILCEFCETHERNRVFINTKPLGEPRLSRYIDYKTIGTIVPDEVTLAAKWCVHYCDGRHDLLDIAERSGVALGVLDEVSELLAKSGLLALPQKREDR
ncbi:MAG: DUF4910 domain-containing protein [Verrucomicrobia bacterium]|nr:DUF4910 domain-containing protein [Verrucomicrobiota bacterium]